MNIVDCVKNTSTFTDLKRNANEYVIDYRRLSFEELKTAVIKTAPQYYNEENVKSVVRFFELNPNRTVRILFDIFIRSILLNCDDFTEEVRITEDKVIAYEQEIIDQANEFSLDDKIENLDFYRFVVEAAWENNDDITPDEQNLINRIKKRMKVSERNHQILEAQIGKFPTPNNTLHTKGDVVELRRLLQMKGVVFSVRDSNGIDYDVIPTEIADCIRRIYNIDIKESSFKKILEEKYVKNKTYLMDLLTKAGVSLPKNANLTQLKDLALKSLTAHQLIGGFSANDGLDKGTLGQWCGSIGVSIYGTKPELIDRIITYYDKIKQVELKEEDEREFYYHFFCDLATRNLSSLHQQGVISKDIECERKFEEATNYIFEKIFKIKPLLMSGTEHPDGMLSFNDRLIMWDNKSKETKVSLAEHIKQFDRYIKNSSKPVAVFMVIAPEFTEDSAKECAKYALTSDTIILLITAKELKGLAERWAKLHENDLEPLPLGVFKQNGRFNPDLAMI